MVFQPVQLSFQPASHPLQVTRIFVLRLCALMRGTTRELSYEEDWVPVPTAARNLTPYAVSAFPLRFGEMLTTALDHVTE